MAGALALTLTACQSGPTKSESTESASTTNSAAAGGSLSGTINGSGASSQTKAQQAWRDNFRTIESGVTVNYEATGSGTGREQFIGGQVAFAGSDAALSAEELTKATATCNGAGVVELPVYISPIAIAYNLPGVKDLKLSAQNVADIFSGKVKKWNDESIAANNKGADLPDLDIIPVNRADKSGTTENFTAYLAEAAGDAWSFEPAEVWPIEGTQSAEKTSGVVQLAQSVEGSITYADASQIGNLGAAQIEVGSDFLAYSPEAAAKVVDGSPAASDATDTILTYDLKRDGSIAGAYPIVMISYLIGCEQYSDAATAANVKAYFSYIASDEGQKVATAAGGGNAPISDDLRTKVQAAIDTIK
ncbi:phosphate ABC transporter substrate-binding protein PstS [Arcanobacterium haemolyticum]|nr:phosphate ABC transporter substrate-binding protein PstS [Arcanobacterium haemolyticum]